MFSVCVRLAILLHICPCFDFLSNQLKGAERVCLSKADLFGFPAAAVATTDAPAITAM